MKRARNSDSATAAAISNLARTTLRGFLLASLPNYRMGWIHHRVCDELDQFLLDVQERKSPRLMLCLPPRHGKSEIASRRFPAYVFGRFPDLSIIGTSYSADLSSRMSKDVQRIMGSEVYRSLFPGSRLASSGGGEKGDRTYAQTVDFFEVVGRRGTYRAAGVGGGITGMGGEILIIDDPVKDRADADSPTIRNRIWDWYTSTLYTRLAPGGGIIVIMTRWHPIQDDVPVLTMKGWKRHGDLAVGDQVFGLDGKPVEVTHVGEPVWCDAEIRTRGESVVCGRTHLWPVRISPGGPVCNITTEAMMAQEAVTLPPSSIGWGDIEASAGFAPAERCGFGRCITTTAHDGLYLVGRTLLPTHNCDDLAGRLLEAQRTGEGDAWRVINFPAVAETDEYWGDILVRHEGEALHPERYPLEQLRAIRGTIGHRDWEALYQQKPTPDGGTIFKAEWLKFYTPADRPKKFDQIVTSWDMTFKEASDSDYCVGQVWGKAGGGFFLLDQVRARMGFTQTLSAVTELTKKWPHASRHLIEDTANGPAIIDTLRTAVPGVIPVKPEGSKTARAFAVTTYFEAGNVFLPLPECAPWVSDYVAELTQFPVVAHDDQVDATTQALRDLKTTQALRIDPRVNRPTVFGGGRFRRMF